MNVEAVLAFWDVAKAQHGKEVFAFQPLFIGRGSYVLESPQPYSPPSTLCLQSWVSLVIRSKTNCMAKTWARLSFWQTSNKESMWPILLKLRAKTLGSWPCDWVTSRLISSLKVCWNGTFVLGSKFAHLALNLPLFGPNLPGEKCPGASCPGAKCMSTLSM